MSPTAGTISRPAAATTRRPVPRTPRPPVGAPQRVGADLLTDVVLLTVALAAGLGAARLTRGPATAHVLLPIAACVVAGHLVVALLRYLRMPDPLPSVAGVLGVGLVAVWTLLPRSTRGGVPTSTTVRVLLHTFTDAGTVIRSQPTPVTATAGVILCLAAGAGLAAVFARTLWSWQEIRQPGARRPLVALFPTFGLFCYTALLSSDIDRVTGTAIYLATALVFLAVADRPVVAHRRFSLHSGLSTALVMAAVAVAVPVVASPGLAGLKLDAIPFSQGGSKNGPPGANATGGGGSLAGVGALNLIDNMRGVLTSRSDLVMFTATSPTPTYWQVATLSQYTGNAWIPDPSTRAAASAPQLAPTSLPILTEPPPTRNFTVHVSIDFLRSTLLPAPPDTVSVGDSTAVQVEPGIGVTQPFANPQELTYDAVARDPSPLSVATEPTVTALDASIPAADLAPYLALPSLPSIPAAVVQLAHQIVAGISSPGAQATALVRYFTQGKRFRYTLTPPPVSGPSALASFLFTTRAGFCQQFAGAFGVLARIDGLPTRLAIGFTTGTTTARNTYSVTGADAHSWPQVYLGASTGWVSFEPTPATTDETLGAGVLNGSRPTTPKSNVAASTTTTLSDKRLQGAGVQPASGAKGLGSLGRSPSTATRGQAAWGTVVLIALGLVALVLAIVVAGPWAWRRRRPRLRRRHFARSGAPRTEILARWEQASSVLARTGLGRRPSETFEEHATRLAVESARTGPTVASVFTAPPGPVRPADIPAQRALDAYRALAALAARASYAPDPCTEEEVAEARRLSDELRTALRHGAPGRGAPMAGARP